MSGDVQPRKRKDKRRRKDELSVEEPRGTAAVFGEGDVFMHSQHEHGTGGHWCAKVIFFSLLAVLVTLIGLIILENRGLSELEANSVESRYSGVLEGWLEDTPDDDHHDEHTLELKHHNEEDDGDDHDIIDEEHDVHDDEEDEEQADDADEDETEQKGEELDEDDDDDSHNNDEDDENDEENDTEEDGDDDNVDRDQHQEDDDDDDDDEDQNLDSDEIEEDEDERNFRKYYESIDEDDDGDDDDDDDDDDNDNKDNDEYDDQNVNNDENDEDQIDDSNEEGGKNTAEYNVDSNHGEDDDDQQLDEDDNTQEKEDSNEYNEAYATRQYEEEGDEDESAEDEDIEVEKIEKEVSDEEVLEEAAASSAEEKQQEDDKSEELSKEEAAPEEDQTNDEEEFLEPEDIEEPVVIERITAPAGKPLPEVEEGTSTEKPLDTLAEEEEYEKQQEELRRQKDQASHLWLKLAVGGALLVATHAVMQRATAPRDSSLSAEHTSREDTPSTIDRRMTLIPEEPSIATDESEEIPSIVKEVEKLSSVTSKSVPLPTEKCEEEEDEELEIETKNEEATELENDDEDKELYSDEEIVEEEEPEVEIRKEDVKETVQETKEKTKESKELVKNEEQDEEVPEDVEIIDDEQLEEEIIEEEEEDEEDISDVDDAELLSRLEAKYGRLPEPERPGPKKDGGNSLEDEWPGEPSEQYWRQQLDEAERELRQGAWSAAEKRASAAELRASARARYIRARALDAAAEARRDNRLLSQSIAAYLELLKMNERLSDKKLLEITNRTLDRIRFRGNYLNAEPVYRLLIRRFPDDPTHRNNLSISFLMANRADLAEEVLKETLRIWPDDRVALAHLGFVLKTTHNKLEEAVDAMRKALEGDVGAANEPRFYFHLGDALLLLGRFKEAEEVHKRGAALGHFLSPAQRSLYNVERLKSRPWWNVEETPYARLARNLEASWKTILKEGEAARALYEQEKEGLKERGEWSQLDLFVRGQEIPGRCKKAPTTCSVVRQELAAVGCKRGQIKFSAMEAGTHVRPHVGPTNCRLRMHLGLSNTKDTYIRVDKEIRQWQAGKVLMFDDSFEHEVWHNGTGSRLVLIVDVWHPALTPAERRALPAI